MVANQTLTSARTRRPLEGTVDLLLLQDLVHALRGQVAQRRAALAADEMMYLMPQSKTQLATDLHLAALAIENQADLHSNDTDFGRFPGLRWRNPLDDEEAQVPPALFAVGSAEALGDIRVCGHALGRPFGDRARQWETLAGEPPASLRRWPPEEGPESTTTSPAAAAPAPPRPG